MTVVPDVDALDGTECGNCGHRKVTHTGSAAGYAQCFGQSIDVSGIAAPGCHCSGYRIAGQNDIDGWTSTMVDAQYAGENRDAYVPKPRDGHDG